jgi:hypothetical protein
MVSGPLTLVPLQYTPGFITPLKLLFEVVPAVTAGAVRLR